MVSMIKEVELKILKLLYLRAVLDTSSLEKVFRRASNTALKYKNFKIFNSTSLIIEIMTPPAARLLAVLCAAALAALALAAPAPQQDLARSRAKRQSADVRTAEYLAWIALNGRLPGRGCDQVACG